MLKRIWVLIIFALLLAACNGAPVDREDLGSVSSVEKRFPYEFRDSNDVTVTVPEKPKKVAVLLSSLADVWTVSGGTVAITVGETIERGFADASPILVDDGAGKTINLELLIASEPDLVIYSADIAGQQECAEALRNAGIPTAGFRVDTFNDYLDLLKICTVLTDKTERYEIYGTALKTQISECIEFAQKQSEKPKYLFVRAGSSAKYTKAKTAEENFVCSMLDELGGINIADVAPILLDGLSTEEILLADPDVIFFTTMGDEAIGTSYMQSILNDPAWSKLTAVQNGEVYQLPKEMFQYKPNARWYEAYQYLFDLLYKE